MDSANDIYNYIGQKIVDTIPGKWLNATINFHSTGNNVKTFGTFLDQESEQKSISLKLGFEGAKKILRLKEITAENEKNKWNKAVFSMTPNGEFDMEFIWDQELQDEVESFSE